MKILAYLLAIGGILFLAGAVGHAARDNSARAEIAELEKKHADTLRAAAEKHAKELQTAREEERLVRAELTKVDAQAAKENEDAKDALRRADDVVGRLRARVAGLEARVREAGSAAPAGQCQAAEEASRVHAEMWRRTDAFARELAEYADAAGTAGTACERSYTAVEVNFNGPRD